MRFTSRNTLVAIAGAVALALAVAVGVFWPPEDSVPESAGGEPSLVGMRRLTEQQYRNTIADVFGRNIVFVGRFDPLLRTEGLLTLGAGGAGVTPSGFEQFYEMAHAIAAQVTNETNRITLIPCKPADATKPDDACAAQYFASIGRLLYRRSLETAEVKEAVDASREVANTTNDFYAGLADGLATMLMSPRFLYVVDSAYPDSEQADRLRLSSYAKAAKLSFLLWNTTPDEALLQAAERGELATRAGLNRQIDRMIASPRLEQGVRAFIEDFLGFDKFNSLEKDSAIYPSFVPKVGRDAQEQMLMTIVDHLAVQAKDYRELFTTRKTFMTASLARIYRVAVSRPDGGWEPYEFPAGDPRGAGILSLVGFLSVNSHPGISSPTLRGKAIRELLLCQKVPDPPGDVDFSKFNDPDSPHPTSRDRMTAHSTFPACAGCHKITDPMGLSLEHFDGAGQARTTENGATIDVSGDLDGIAFSDEVGLGKAMAAHPGVPSCFANRLFAYALGRPTERSDREIETSLQKSFAKDGYKVPALLKRIASHDALYRVSAHGPSAGKNHAAAQ